MTTRAERSIDVPAARAWREHGQHFLEQDGLVSVFIRLRLVDHFISVDP